MRTFTDGLRMVLAGLAAFVAAIGIAIVLMRSGLGPEGGVGAGFTWSAIVDTGRIVYAVLALFVSLGLAFAYATWFDALLNGPAVWRGVQFGVASWLWLATMVVLVTQSGWVHPSASAWGWMALLTGIPFVVHGAVMGLVYGTGRHYDEYLAGMGYGLPDRQSLG